MKLGPDLPRKLINPSLVELGKNVYIIGGYYKNKQRKKIYEKEIHKFACVSGACSWTTLNQQLKVGREDAVAIPVIDSFCTPKSKLIK